MCSVSYSRLSNRLPACRSISINTTHNVRVNRPHDEFHKIQPSARHHVRIHVASSPVTIGRPLAVTSDVCLPFWPQPTLLYPMSRPRLLDAGWKRRGTLRCNEWGKCLRPAFRDACSRSFLHMILVLSLPWMPLAFPFIACRCWLRACPLFAITPQRGNARSSDYKPLATVVATTPGLLINKHSSVFAVYQPHGRGHFHPTSRHSSGTEPLARYCTRAYGRWDRHRIIRRPIARHSTTAESKPMGAPSPTEFCQRKNDRYRTYMDRCCMLTLAGWSLQQQAVWDGTQADWTDQTVTEAPVSLTAREQGRAPPCWTCQYQG
ncbi:hypothetical protein HDV57DRAFT_494624 [Trichoderma longibrachiatum]